MERKTLFQGRKFEIYNKETQQNEASELINAVYINEHQGQNGPFKTVTVVAKDGTYHQSFLNEPRTEEQLELSKKIAQLTPEQQKALLEQL